MMLRGMSNSMSLKCKVQKGEQEIRLKIYDEDRLQRARKEVKLRWKISIDCFTTHCTAHYRYENAHMFLS